MMTTTTEKACLLMLILVWGTECFVESGDLKISENCRRLTKMFSVCVEMPQYVTEANLT